MINIEDSRIESNFSGAILEDKLIIPRCYEIDYMNKEDKIKITISNEEKRGLTDCIIGKWYNENNKYILYLIVNIDGKEKIYNKIKEKNESVRNNLPKIIKSILNVENKLFMKNKELEDTEVFIKFNSMNDEFYKVENWGKINNYKNVTSNNVEHMDNINLKEEIIIATLKHHIEIYLVSRYGRGIIYFIEGITLGEMRKINDFNYNVYEVIVTIKLTNNENSINLKAIIDESKIIMKEY